MKKTKTIVIALIVAIVLLTAGGILFGIGFAQVEGETPEGEFPPIFSEKYFHKENVSLSDACAASGTDAIKISSDICNVQLTSAAENVGDISVKMEGEFLYLGKKIYQPALTLERIGGELSVKAMISENNVNYAGSWFFRSTVTVSVTLPADMQMRALNVQTAAGNVSVEPNIRLDEIDLATASGNIYANLKESKKLAAQSVSGNVRALSQTGLDSVELSAVSGDVKAELSGGNGTVTLGSFSGNIDASFESARKATMEAKSGNVYVSGTVSDLSVETMSGNLRAEGAFESYLLKSSSGNVSVIALKAGSGTLSSMSGNVRLAMAAGENFTITYTGVSGDFKDSYGGGRKYGNSYRYGSGGAAITVNTTSGNFILLKSEV